MQNGNFEVVNFSYIVYSHSLFWFYQTITSKVQVQNSVLRRHWMQNIYFISIPWRWRKYGKKRIFILFSKVKELETNIFLPHPPRIRLVVSHGSRVHTNVVLCILLNLPKKETIEKCTHRGNVHRKRLLFTDVLRSHVDVYSFCTHLHPNLKK